MKTKIYVPLLVIALVCMVVWAAYAQGSRSNPGRQAWEYKALVYLSTGPRPGLYEDGKLLPGSPTPISRAPELGAEGWELVAVTGTESGTYGYWFKRPK